MIAHKEECVRSILDEALRLADLGLAIHWLRAPTGGMEDGRGKAPIHKGWQHLPHQSPAQLETTYRAGLNVGLHTGRVVGAAFRIIVVDCDSPEAARYCARKLPMPPVRSRTASGFHLFYRHPGGALEIPNRAHIDGVKLDLRGDGGNIVLPPSVHPSGFVYEARGDWTAKGFAALPVFDPTWFPRPAETPREAIRLARTPTITEARRVLAKMQPSISGQGGDKCLWSAALTLATRFSLSENEIESLLLTDFNPRCDPPWPEARIRYKAAQAVRARAAHAARTGGDRC